MTPQQPLTVTLEAQQWNAVMALLSEGPYRIAAPLIEAIQRQCMAASTSLLPMMQGNGEDTVAQRQQGNGKDQ